MLNRFLVNFARSFPKLMLWSKPTLQENNRNRVFGKNSVSVYISTEQNTVFVYFRKPICSVPFVPVSTPQLHRR